MTHALIIHLLTDVNLTKSSKKENAMNAERQQNKTLDTTVITGEGRGSYVSIFQPALNMMSGKEEYSMAFLISKDDVDTVNAINKAVEAATTAKWPDASKRPPNLRSPLRDGDTEKPNDEAYAGHYWVNVKTKNQPGIIDAQMRPVLDVRDFVSGDYCRISANAYAYDQKGNRGVALGLSNVQVTSKGEPLSGAGRRAEDDFSAFGPAAGASEDPWS
jgi:hypothetical protein